MRKSTIIAVYNNKGGVGKSTFSVNFLHSIVSQFKKDDGSKYKVLLVDNDGQSNATLTLTGKTEDEISNLDTPTIFDMIVEEDVTAKNCVTHTLYPSIDIIPATDDHSDTPDAISSYMDNTRIMKEKLQSVANEYDFIVIDCAPTRDRNIYNALFAADVVITPLETQRFSQVGLRNLLEQINKINKRRDTALLHYVFLSKVDNRQKVSNQKIKNNLQSKLGDDFLDEYISLLSLYSKSFEENLTAINYSDNRGAIEMKRLTSRILTKINEELI